MVDGLDLVRMGEAARRAHRIRRLGFVFQDFPLVEHLDVLDNVMLPFRLNRALTLDGGVRKRGLSLLDRLGLVGKSRRRPSALSQGERQRVAIARALIAEPALLLADEPTAGLDPQRSLDVMRMLEGLSAERGLTLLLVTHDPALLERFDNTLDVSRLSLPKEPAGGGA